MTARTDRNRTKQSPEEKAKLYTDVFLKGQRDVRLHTGIKFPNTSDPVARAMYELGVKYARNQGM